METLASSNKKIQLAESEGRTYEDSKDNFAGWLDSVSKVFVNLSPHQQEVILKRLIGDSNPELKYKFMNYVLEVLQQDIFNLLPLELQILLGSYIDGKCLLTACSVSKNWNRIISSLEIVWHTKCKQDGFEEMAGNNWKEKYVRGQRFIEAIRKDSAFLCATLQMTMFGGHGVSELFVSNEFLYACAGREVCIWNVGSDMNKIPVVYFLTHHRISSMCGHEPRHLIFGHTSGHLSKWKWELTGKVEMIMEFVGHVGPVMCVTACKELELLASGGVDCNLKLWCLKKRQFLLKQAVFPSIVKKVKLSQTSSPATPDTGKGVLLIKVMGIITVYQWHVKQSDLCSRCKHGISDEMLLDTAEIAVEDYPHNAFPSQHFFAHGKLFFVRTPSCNEMVVYDLSSKQEVEVISLTEKCPFTLAVGKKFALVMQEAVSAYHSFSLLNVKTKAEVVKWKLPPSRCNHHVTVKATVPCNSWLDDLGSHVPGQLVLAFTDTLNQISVVFWKRARILERQGPSEQDLLQEN